MRGAKSLAEFKALKQEALKPQAAKPPPAAPPAGKPPASGTPPDLAKPPVEGDPAAPGDGDATPAPEGRTTPENPETRDDDDADDDDSEAGGPPQITTAKSIRLSPSQTDKVGRLTATLMKRNRDWSMEQALVAAKDQLGLNTPAPNADAPNAQSDLPKTVDEVNTTLKRLKAEKLALTIGLRFEEAGAIEDKIDQLMEHRSTLRENAEREAGERETTFHSAYAASEAKTLALYPFASDPATPGAKRMIEIDADLKANGDPLYNSPDKPLKVAQMAAAELNIAPLRKGASPAPKPPAGAAPAVTPPKRQVLPGGASQTTPAPVNQIPADVARVSGIKTLADLRAEKKRLGLPN